LPTCQASGATPFVQIEPQGEVTFDC